MKIFARAIIIVALALAALPAAAATLPELHIMTDGSFVAKNVSVYQKSGTTLFCRATWGNAFVRFTVFTSPNLVSAQVLRNHGGTTTVDEIEQGDFISIEGSLVPAADSLQINAKKIVDFNLNKEPKTVSGTIGKTTLGALTLVTKTLGTVALSFSTDTAITKGIRTLDPSQLVVRDKVLSASGIYNYASSTFAVSKMDVFQDKSVFKARTFEGTIRTISGAALPASLVVDTPNASYTVYLAAGAQVLNTARAAVNLSRFAVGDKVRFFGSIRQDNLANVDATIIRDLNF